ncbi:MAG: signal peptidase I [Elusimicrobia bacterium]|nr:signal peptidase I [Elusimicrobiota bacterium]
MRLGRVLYLLLIALGIALPTRWWALEPIYIASGSMEPTLPVGRHLFVDKMTLRFRAIRQGDIISFEAPAGENRDMVKRVIALPGQAVELREKKVYVEGKLLDEPYARHKRGDERLQGDNLGPLLVPPRSYFVLGDNRDESDDSTVWRDSQGQPLPFVPEKNIAGLVRGVY